jgi:hypothetical protein
LQKNLRNVEEIEASRLDIKSERRTGKGQSRHGLGSPRMQKLGSMVRKRTIAFKDQSSWEADAQEGHDIGRDGRGACGQEPHSASQLGFYLGKYKSVPERASEASVGITLVQCSALLCKSGVEKGT